MEGIRIVQSLANSTLLKEKYGIEYVVESFGDCDVLEFDSDDYWRCALRYMTGPENHQLGTCKMGPEKDEMAVVDSKLAVHGISGLRIADSSIIPSPISGNNHAPIVMIAERCADFVKDFWL